MKTIETTKHHIRLFFFLLFLIVPTILVRIIPQPGVVRLIFFSISLIFLSSVLLYIALVPGRTKWYILPMFAQEEKYDMRHFVLSVILRVSAILIIFLGLFLTTYGYTETTIKFLLGKIQPTSLVGFKKGDSSSMVPLLLERFQISESIEVYTHVYPVYYNSRKKYQFNVIRNNGIDFILDIKPVE